MQQFRTIVCVCKSCADVLGCVQRAKGTLPDEPDTEVEMRLNCEQEVPEAGGTVRVLCQFRDTSSCPIEAYVREDIADIPEKERKTVVEWERCPDHVISEAIIQEFRPDPAQAALAKRNRIFAHTDGPFVVREGAATDAKVKT